jgi:signal transduction histidine kinase
MTLFNLIFLIRESLLSLDAIIRTIVRTWVTRRGLLEWETAAESENTARATAPVDLYLGWTPAIAAVIAPLLVWLRPALLAAIPILMLWLLSGGVAIWLDRQPFAAQERLSIEDFQWLHHKGEPLSRELHDEVGQMLTALRMELRSLHDLRSAPENEFEDRLDSAKRLAEQSLKTLRDLAMGLRPSMLG